MVRLQYLFFAILFCLTGVAHAAIHTFEITWTVDESAINIAEYHLYAASDLDLANILCTASGSATTMQCSLEIDDSIAQASYVLTSYSDKGEESIPSEPFTVVFEQIASPLQASLRLSVQEGTMTVAADASESSGNITEFKWQFGDGTELETTELIVNHTYSAAGTYAVTLEIHDNEGNSDIEQKEIRIDDNQVTNTASSGSDGYTSPSSDSLPAEEKNKTPVARLTLLTSPMGTLPVIATFDASGSSDPDGDPLTFVWNFGDGTSVTGSSRISHQYDETGSYTVTVSVTDDKGASDTVSSQPILVQDSGDDTQTGPVAVILTNTTTTIPSALITFNGSASRPSDMNASITRYSWNFGDGITGTGVSITHRYEQEGSYSAQLIVTDSTGRQDMKSINILITDKDDNNKKAALLIQVYEHLLLNKDQE